MEIITREAPPRRTSRELNRMRAEVKERLRGQKVTVRYFQRLRNDDFILEFCVVRLQGAPPGAHHVYHTLADGSLQEWPCREESGLLVFKAPDGYAGGAGDAGHIIYAPPKGTLADAMVFESNKVYSFGGSGHALAAGTP